MKNTIHWDRPQLHIAKDYVVFTGSDHWLFKGTGHCYMMRWTGYLWILIDKSIDGLDVRILDSVIDRELECGEDLLTPLMDDGKTTIVEVDTKAIRLKYADTSSNFFMAIIRSNSCVESIKNILGMNTLYPFTPKQLRSLLWEL